MLFHGRERWERWAGEIGRHSGVSETTREGSHTEREERQKLTVEIVETGEAPPLTPWLRTEPDRGTCNADQSDEINKCQGSGKQDACLR